MTERQQFNIYLPPDLVRQVKYAALDDGVSLSRYVEDALRARIASESSASERESASGQEEER